MSRSQRMRIDVRLNDGRVGYIMKFKDIEGYRPRDHFAIKVGEEQVFLPREDFGVLN